MSKDVVSQLSSSGFPFQTAVAAAIRGLNAFHETTEEIGWRDRNGVDQFLDIVAVSYSTHLLIECKKSSKGLVFLLPQGSDGNESGFYGIVMRPVDAPSRYSLRWTRGGTHPRSHNATHCVSLAGDGHDERLLEHIVKPLVRATESYAIDRYRDPRSSELREVAIVPVLVTTSPLYVAQYDPAESISLKTGIYSAKESELTPVNLVRFTKEFSTTFKHQCRQRTVFVVQAPAIAEILPLLSNANARRDDGVLLADALSDTFKGRPLGS